MKIASRLETAEGRTLTSQPPSSEITDGTLRIAAAPVLEDSPRPGLCSRTRPDLGSSCARRGDSRRARKGKAQAADYIYGALQ